MNSKSVIAFLASRGIAAASTLAFLIFATRYLPKEVFGIYGISVSAIMSMNAILFTWVRFSYLYETGHGNTSEKDIRVQAFSIVFTLSLLALGIGLAGSFFLKSWLPAIMGFAAVFAGLHGVHLERARQSFNTRLYGFLWSGRALIAAGGGAVLIISGYGAVPLILMYTASFAVPMLFARLIPWKALARINIAETVRWAKYGFPVAFAYSADTIVSQTDRQILMLYGGSSMTGAYSAAYDILWPLTLMIGMSVVSSFLPKAISERQNADKNAATLLRSAFQLYVLFLAPVLVFSFFVGQYQIITVIGDSYRGEFVMLAPLLTAGCAVHIARICFFEVPFQVEGKVSVGVKATIIAIIANLLISALLVSKYGIEGVVAGTITGHLCALAYSSFYVPVSIKNVIDLPFAGIAAAVSIALFMSLPQLSGGNIYFEIILMALAAGIYLFLMTAFRRYRGSFHRHNNA